MAISRYRDAAQLIAWGGLHASRTGRGREMGPKDTEAGPGGPVKPRPSFCPWAQTLAKQLATVLATVSFPQDQIVRDVRLALHPSNRKSNDAFEHQRLQLRALSALPQRRR